VPSAPASPPPIPAEDAAPSFDAFLAQIGIELLGAPLEAIDAALDHALWRLIAFLAIERAAIALPDPASGIASVSHCVAAPGVPRVPIGLSEAALPWLTRQLRARRQPVIVSLETAFAPDEAIDLVTVRAHGMKSVAFLPIAAGTRLLGVLSLGTAHPRWSWSPALMNRLRLVASIFAGACLRMEHERQLLASRAEAERLRVSLQAERGSQPDSPFSPEGFADIVGESSALRDVLLMAEQVAPTDTTVLLLGETGTGKELIAKAIHAKSHRGGRPLVTVNCAALPPTLIESELFGHEKGAFTGAVARKIGRFELADQGTLFLDEIGELPLELQAKLLRVLQEGEFERVGSASTRTVDVRIIAASNRDLTTAAREGSFRPDLYYRLAVFPIQVPALRDRSEDIPLLVWHFLAELGTALGRKIERVPSAAMKRLVAHRWPGNIRELRNVVERAIIRSPGPTLALEGLSQCPAPTAASSGSQGPVALADIERAHIVRVLDHCRWRVRGPRNAAEQLGLNASTLYSRMKKLGIRRDSPDQDVGGDEGDGASGRSNLRAEKVR
jgi:transcriptional regulator with GAF, ATPase, and Fis domain